MNALDYLAQLQALLPPGAAFSHEKNASITRLLNAFADEFARVDNKASQWIDESDPRTATELLPDWERVAGFPDPILGLATTIQERRRQLVTRLTAVGGQSIAYFESFAAALGFPIAVSEFSPFRMGMNRMGDPLGGPEWAFTWAVDAGPINLTWFRTGVSAMGEPLQTWGNSILEAEIRKFAPAHTIVIFRYPLADADFGPFILDSSQLG